MKIHAQFKTHRSRLTTVR